MQSSANDSSRIPSVDEVQETFHCPTRTDGAEALIAQMITVTMCQGRQRRSYHKCWTCLRRNGAVRLESVPVLRDRGAEAV